MGKAEFETEMASVRVELDSLLARLSPTTLRQPGILGDWSRADIVAHFAGYTRDMTNSLALARGSGTGRPDYDVWEGMNIDQFNDVVVGYWRLRPTMELLNEERLAFSLLLSEVNQLTEATFESAGFFSFTGGRSLASILPGATFLHYQEHLGLLTKGSSVVTIGKKCPRLCRDW